MSIPSAVEVGIVAVRYKRQGRFNVNIGYYF